jgi:hypothetical protein
LTAVNEIAINRRRRLARRRLALAKKKIGFLPKAQDGRPWDPAIPDAFLDRAISRRQKNLLDMNAAEFRQLALGKRLRSMGPQFNCLPRLSAESMSPT